MTYVAPGRTFLKNRLGTDSSVIVGELAKIDTELDTLTTANGKAAVNIIDLTASMNSSSSLAANGVDLASGTNHTYYAVFIAPVACTIVSMESILTEAYVKETTDAKIELIDNAGSPVTRVTYTLPAAGRAVKSMVSTAPVDSTKAILAAGDILNLATTESASSSGTGHAKVFMRYTVN
jgi:hypothetical protein